jgi:hypothetical protein
MSIKLRFVGNTPFANKAWRMYKNDAPTNWYLAKFYFGAATFCNHKPAFVVFAWRGGDAPWSIPAGMLDISPRRALQFIA